jgi:hypothetical protein
MQAAESSLFSASKRFYGAEDILLCFFAMRKPISRYRFYEINRRAGDYSNFSASRAVRKTFNGMFD